MCSLRLPCVQQGVGRVAYLLPFVLGPTPAGLRAVSQQCCAPRPRVADKAAVFTSTWDSQA